MPEGQTISDQERSDQRVQQASRAVAWNGVLSISAALFGVAASVVTFRLLTKEQFGCLNTTTNYLRYASLLALFTLDTALLRYIPEYRARGDRKGLTDLLAKVFTVHFVVWAALVAVVSTVATGALDSRVGPRSTSSWAAAGAVTPVRAQSARAMIRVVFTSGPFRCVRVFGGGAARSLVMH